MRDNDHRLALDIRTGMGVLAYGVDLETATVQVMNAQQLKDAGKNWPYERVVLSWESASNATVERLVGMTEGLVAVLVRDQDEEVQAANWFRRNHPFEDCWRFTTDIGRMVVSTASRLSRFRV